MAFRVEPAGDGRLAASGELEFATAASALAAGLALIGAQRHWTVDLAGVTAGDSAGLAVLVEWISAARARGGTLRYEAVPQQILAIARISDLEGLLLAQSA
ncbi:MAG: STAS domain-containing protein [Steroidobacteraceae bacterium]|nr:STAS domain-containing protein [Steroidobacteraceae bacterium]